MFFLCFLLLFDQVVTSLSLLALHHVFSKGTHLKCPSLVSIFVVNLSWSGFVSCSCLSKCLFRRDRTFLFWVMLVKCLSFYICVLLRVYCYVCICYHVMFVSIITFCVLLLIVTAQLIAASSSFSMLATDIASGVSARASSGASASTSPTFASGFMMKFITRGRSFMCTAMWSLRKFTIDLFFPRPSLLA